MPMEFLVLLLMRCIARSACSISSSCVRACSGKEAMPSEAVMRMPSPSPSSRDQEGLAARSRRARARRPPAPRATRSRAARCRTRRRRSGTACRSAGSWRGCAARPRTACGCPWRGRERLLTSFRLSMSRKIRESGERKRLARASSSARQASKWRRLKQCAVSSLITSSRIARTCSALPTAGRTRSSSRPDARAPARRGRAARSEQQGGRSPRSRAGRAATRRPPGGGSAERRRDRRRASSACGTGAVRRASCRTASASSGRARPARGRRRRRARRGGRAPRRSSARPEGEPRARPRSTAIACSSEHPELAPSGRAAGGRRAAPRSSVVEVRGRAGAGQPLRDGCSVGRAASHRAHCR